MRHNKYKLFLSLMTAMLVLVMLPAEAFAESNNGSGSCSFNGSEIVSDFSDGTIADTVSGLQPGDDMTFTVEYTNDSGSDTDWYMETSIIQTLEKTDSAKKTVDGTETPENGGYTYELIHTDNDGNETVLFSNDEVGGEATPGDMQGLEQATNALDDWFYLQTIGEGGHGTLTLKVALEGETEVNDYMDTEGALDLRFAVELTRKDASSGTSDNDGSKKSSGVNTGDRSDLMPWMIACIAAGFLLLVMAILSLRRDRKEAEANEEV